MADCPGSPVDLPQVGFVGTGQNQLGWSAVRLESFLECLEMVVDQFERAVVLKDTI